MATSWVTYGKTTFGQGLERIRNTWERADGRAILDRAAASARNVLAIANLESLHEDQRALSFPAPDDEGADSHGVDSGATAPSKGEEAGQGAATAARHGVDLEGGTVNAVEREAEEVATRQRIPDMYVRLSAGRSRTAVARERATTACAAVVGLVLFWWFVDLWFVTHE